MARQWLRWKRALVIKPLRGSDKLDFSFRSSLVKELALSAFWFVCPKNDNKNLL